MLHVGQKTEVEHLVGFVQHKRGHPREIEHAPLVHIQQPPGGAHDHVGAVGQRLRLGFDRAPPEDRDQRQVQPRGGLLELAGDLQAQLAGGHDHQDLDMAVLGGDALQGRQAKGQRLARAGAGLADDVRARQGHGQRELLDGEGLGDARVGQGVAQRRVDAEVGERAGFGGAVGVGGHWGDRFSQRGSQGRRVGQRRTAGVASRSGTAQTPFGFWANRALRAWRPRRSRRGPARRGTALAGRRTRRGPRPAYRRDRATGAGSARLGLVGVGRAAGLQRAQPPPRQPGRRRHGAAAPRGGHATSGVSRR